MKLAQEEEVRRKTVDRRDSISSQDESQDTVEVSGMYLPMYLHFRTSTPSKSEIFSLKSVTVACSYIFAFQDQYTLQK